MPDYYRHNKTRNVAEVVYSDDKCVQYRQVGGSGIVMTDVRSIFNGYFTLLPDSDARPCTDVAAATGLLRRLRAAMQEQGCLAEWWSEVDRMLAAAEGGDRA